jgi:hypothetical protein
MSPVSLGPGTICRRLRRHDRQQSACRSSSGTG